MKIAIVGSRRFIKESFMEQILLSEFQNYPNNIDHPLTCKDITIISGGAKGVDSYAEKFAKQWSINTKIFLPDWDKYGKSAGFKRNQLIIDEADKIIAFWDGISKGTKSSIDLAIKSGKPVDIYIRS